MGGPVYQAAYYQANKARLKEYKRAHYDKAWFRRFRYGVTAEDYTLMVARQGGLCAICGKPETAKDAKGRVRNLCIDHNHLTGRVRGLLCFHCNYVLSTVEGTRKRNKGIPSGYNAEAARAYLAASAT